MFSGGVMMLGMAVFFRLLNLWGYKADDDYDRSKRIVNWFGVIGFSLGGLIVIFVSLCT